MQLPAMFHGRYRDVKRDVDHIVRRIVRGDDWTTLIEKEGFVDVEGSSGLILLDGPNPIFGSEAHFQAWLLWSRVENKAASLRSELMQRVFEQSLARPWATLGLMAHGNTFWLSPRERFRPFLQAVRQYWAEYAVAGARYSNGIDHGMELWSVPNTLGYVLANLRVPREVYDSLLPQGRIAELIDRTEGVEPIVHPLPGA